MVYSDITSLLEVGIGINLAIGLFQGVRSSLYDMLSIKMTDKFEKIRLLIAEIEESNPSLKDSSCGNLADMVHQAINRTRKALDEKNKRYEKLAKRLSLIVGLFLYSLLVFFAYVAQLPIHPIVPIGIAIIAVLPLSIYAGSLYFGVYTCLKEIDREVHDVESYKKTHEKIMQTVPSPTKN